MCRPVTPPNDDNSVNDSETPDATDIDTEIGKPELDPGASSAGIIPVPNNRVDTTISLVGNNFGLGIIPVSTGGGVLPSLILGNPDFGPSSSAERQGGFEALSDGFGFPDTSLIF